MTLRAWPLWLSWLLVALGAWQALRWLPHPDVAYYISSARQLAEGAELYVDIGDVNAPPIYWIHALIHALAGLLGIGDRDMVVLLFAAVSAAVLLWLWRWLPPRAALLLPLLAALLFVPAQSVFAEREHWALVLMLPYLAASLSPNAGRAAALFAAPLAGAACMLKPPYLVLVPVALEAWLAFERRRWSSLWRAEALTAAAAFLATAAIALLAHPAYFERVLPQALAYYTALDHAFASLLTPKGVWLPLAGILYALALVLWRPALLGAQRAAIGALTAVALGFVAAYLLQGKGFSYQWLPALVLGAAAAGAALLALRPRPAALLLLPLAVPLLWAGYISLQQIETRKTAWPVTGPLLEALLESEAKGVFALAPEIYPLFPAVTLAGARWLNTESHLWQLDGLYRRLPETSGFRPPEAQPEEERLLRLALVGRFLLTAPDLVAVFRGGGRPTIGGSDFSYLAYYLSDPAFAEAWRGYVLRQRIGDYDLYAR
jgi:hypothetical protein